MSTERPSVLRRALPLLGLALAAAVLVRAGRELTAVSWPEVLDVWSAVGPGRWALAATFTAASYAALAGYEWLAVRSLGLAVTDRRVWFAGLVSWAISNSLGPAWLSGGAVRLRLYRRWGLTSTDVARIVGFNLLTFWASFGVLAGGALALDPPAVFEPWGRPVGVLALVATAAGAGACLRWRRPVRLGGRSFLLPTPRTLLVQLSVGVADNLAAVAALAVLMPQSRVSFVELASLFAVANVGGILSGLPGGLGTFDGALVSLVTPAVPASTVVATLVAWRVVYGLVPLGFAGFALAAVELRATPARAMLRQARPAVARALAVLSFVAGAGVLATGVLRADPAPLRWLGSLAPVEVLEASHAALAAVGVGLLAVARGLWRRTREAWGTFVALLLASAALAAARGEVADAALALGLLALALPVRGAFDRRAAVGREARTPLGWVALVASAAVLSVVAGRLALGAPVTATEAPRLLRAGGVALAMLSAAVLGQGLRPVRRAPPRPTEADVADALRIAGAAGVSTGWLAATGDKSLLFDDDREAFLMYGAVGDRWVAFTGPIGPRERLPGLLWTFRSCAEAAGARIALYEIPAGLVPLCADLGLRTYKFGEEARVRLAGFTLDGKERRHQRSVVNRLEREGCRFEVLPAGAVDAVLPELRAVSDAWLRDKGAREKGFSLGRFDEDWLRRAPVALVRREGRIEAFANLLPAGPELSIDLMRFRPGAPNGTMDYLFVQLLRSAAAEGYAEFNLGMAPLSGLPRGPVAPAWSRAGALVFDRGERFYNFRGLRSYKEKFHPTWEPRYLAVEGRFGLVETLHAVRSLVG